MYALLTRLFKAPGQLLKPRAFLIPLLALPLATSAVPWRGYARAAEGAPLLRNRSTLQTLAPLALAPSLATLFPVTGRQGQTLTVTLGGHGFLQGALVDFGPGITVNSAVVSGLGGEIGVLHDHILTLNVTIAADAPLGLRDVTVTNPDSQFVTKTDAFTVVDPQAPPTLASFSLFPATARGGTKRSGTIVLTLPAPSPKGAKVTFTSSNPSVKPPKAITVKKGLTTPPKAFVYTTKKVKTQTTATITATYGGVSKSVDVTLTP